MGRDHRFPHVPGRPTDPAIPNDLRLQWVSGDKVKREPAAVEAASKAKGKKTAVELLRRVTAQNRRLLHRAK